MAFTYVTLEERGMGLSVARSGVKIFRFMFLGFSDHSVSLPLFGARTDILSFRSFDPFSPQFFLLH